MTIVDGVAVVLALTAWTSRPVIDIPEPVPVSVARPVAPAAGPTLAGTATWYGTGPGAGHAAAGPGLRSYLGADWRGTRVQVCAGAQCVSVRVTDWCACPGKRVIDLSDEDFSRLASLSRGVINVTVTR